MMVLSAVILINLLLNRHILMYNSDTAFSGNCYSHTGFGNSIHSRCHNRDIQSNSSGQVSGNIDKFRLHLAVSRNKQNIVKRKSFLNELCLKICVEHTNNLPFR